MINEHASAIASTGIFTSYGISLSLMIGDFVAIIDQHTWIIGLIGFITTWITSIVFKIIECRHKYRKDRCL